MDEDACLSLMIFLLVGPVDQLAGCVLGTMSLLARAERGAAHSVYAVWRLFDPGRQLPRMKQVNEAR
jgi:hypothetical protein